MMQRYKLTLEARKDLRSIYHYTRKNWGEKQTQIYTEQLKRCSETLVESPEIGRSLYPMIGNFRIHRCQKHYIVYRREEEIEIIAFLHEKMDLMAQLRLRLTALH